jgi:hypothetical protein
MEAHDAGLHAATQQANVSSSSSRGSGHADPTRVSSANATTAAPAGCVTAALHPASSFPDTLEGYVAQVRRWRAADEKACSVQCGTILQAMLFSVHQVRWSGFTVLLVALGRSLVQLHTALDTLLPLLPGSELRGETPPPPIDAGRWGRVAAAMTSLRPYMRDAQPGACHHASVDTCA